MARRDRPKVVYRLPRPDRPKVVHGGGFYGQRSPGAPLERARCYDGPPDTWICRRVADFPGARVPAGAALATCARCEALIVFNPARVSEVPASTPKVCMQCSGIKPLPIE